MSIPRRIVEDGTYHVMSRIAHRGFFLTPEERTFLLGIVKRSAMFCGVELRAYSIMSNHFHLLVHVSPATELDDGELLRRYEAWQGRKAAEKLALHLSEADRRRLTARMFDLGKFMQLMKEWYTMSYNNRTGHTGTLWEGRYKSVLVEADRVPLTNVAGYIDLNAVRAGMVREAGEYAWSSFGEACQQRIFAQSKYTQLYGVARWEEAATMHRETMARLEALRAAREGKLREIGKLPEGDHVRIRAFTDGVAVGSVRFVERYFQTHRDDFPSGRKQGAKRIAGLPETLCAIRELR